jgi:diguanylate cyclase (GGDEF)-like protein/PAS domain S-box-containing protein
MAEQRTPAGQLNDVLIALLRRPDALIIASADDGFRLPIPASIPLAENRTAPMPADRATAIDLLVPQDTLVVVAAWERAQTKGLAYATVHARHDPQRPLTMTIVDARPLHGVWISGLSDPDADEVEVIGGAMSGALAAPVRPRTATVYKSVLAVITGIDDRATRMLGWTASQMVGARASEFVHPQDQERAVANWLEMLSKKEAVRIRLRQLCADGSWLWVEIENFYQDAEDAADAVVMAQVSDISDEMAMHEALDRRERLLHRLAESLPTGIAQLAADRTVVYANSRMATMLGLPATSSLDELLGPVTAADRPALDAALAEALDHDADTELEVQVRLPLTGEHRVCAVSLISLSDREGVPGALVCVTDVTDSARMREELTAKATFDVLTGCHNRASITAALDDALTVDDGLFTAVVFVDLDKFKQVNDTHGHAAGDELLVQAANRLRSVLRRDDAVGRIGGDEFLLVSRGIASPKAAMDVASRVRKALHRPVELSTGILAMRASIGVACSEPGLDSTTLTRHADLAMYRSKQQGKGQPALYRDPGSDTART